MGMKPFKQWGSTTGSNLRSHVLVPTCHSVSDMSITIVLNFFYIYLYILCMKSVFFKLDKKSLWGCESLHKSPPCSLPHSSTEKCLVVVFSFFPFVPQCLILLGQVSSLSRFLSPSPRGSWRRTSHQQCLQCGLWGIRAAPACPGLAPRTPGVSSRVGESRSGGEVSSGSRGGGWPGPHCPGSSPSSFAPPHQAADGGDGEHHENQTGGQLLWWLCGWTALGRARGQAGAAAAWGGTAGPAAWGSTLQTFRVLQHLLDEGGHGAWDLHLQSDDSLGSCRKTHKNELFLEP